MEETFGFEVTEARRKLWKVELDLFLYFRRICEKNHLRYYAIGGTCLGAAKHKGFIPWDDDMDIGMPFDDYMKFLHIAAEECKAPYYLQCFLTDPERGGITVSRLRRSDTTACTKWEYTHIGAFYNENTNYNLGIWIDLFPMCNIPDDEETREAQKKQIMDVWKAIRGYSALKAKEEGREDVNPEYNAYIESYIALSERYSLQEMKALYTQYCGMNKAPTSLIGLTTFRTFHPRFMWNSEWFSETVDLPFEGIAMPVPIGYEQYLTKMYGDWRVPVIDPEYHEIYMYDADTPYDEVFRKKAKSEQGEETR